jgi:hypothetical protein
MQVHSLYIYRPICIWRVECHSEQLFFVAIVAERMPIGDGHLRLY